MPAHWPRSHLPRLANGRFDAVEDAAKAEGPPGGPRSAGPEVVQRQVRKLKAEADYDLTVDGPNLAAQAIAASLVDEYNLFITTSVVGGGKRFFPDGVRLDLELVEGRPSTAD